MYEEFYAILAHGTDEVIDGMIYRNTQMSPDATRICTGLLTYHLRAPNESDRLIEKAIVTNGDFSLLIVLPSWKPDAESNYIPLIVKQTDAKTAVAGVMMPFNDLVPHLDDTDPEIGELTAMWIVRKMLKK